jgi:FixJ family two-component response regulator
VIAGSMEGKSDGSTVQRASAAPPLVYAVDDDPSFLRAVSRMLRSAGFQVAAFHSAADFLAHRRRNPAIPGCLLLDLKMPGLGGLDLQVINAHEAEPLPVVFLSGQGDVPSSVRAMKQHAVDFLTKPVGAEDLIPALRRAFARDAEAREERRRLRELQARYQKLTCREREVFASVVRGLLNKQIAFEMGTSERTIKAHRAQVMAKMQAQSVAELVRAADRLGARKTEAD